jgi:hypothetical protein
LACDVKQKNILFLPLLPLLSDQPNATASINQPPAMRFSLSFAALAAVASAQEGLFEQYKAQFQNFLGNMGASVPNPGAHDPVAAFEAKTGEMKLSTLTLENWKDTLYEPVPAGAVEPVEWWMFITGGNKTCYGRCGRVEEAFKQAAAKFAVLPNSPHMAIVNCDDQPILCNSWAATPSWLWAFQMLPEPAPIDIYKKRLNTTTTTSDDIVALKSTDRAESMVLLESRFHPFDGQITQMGLAVPIAYALWAFSLVPSWLFMLVISMVSRTMMSNRMNPPQGNQRTG